jgi:glycosyltransferase domain-containing protein
MDTTRVGILISTMNRPEFMIRTLNYYAKQNSPHPVYLIDSSNPEKAGILTAAIEKLKDKIFIDYNWFPPGRDYTDKLLTKVKEKYVCQSGDDDYLIPESLTNCAKFLENNPDYASAQGHAVTFRLNKNGPYGEIKRLADYPRRPIESETASRRLIDFMKDPFSITFGVNRIKHLEEPWKNNIRLGSTLNELVAWGSAAVAGKSKLLDCLSLVRQIHSMQYVLPNSFDWITDKVFSDDYILFKNFIAKLLVEKDNVSIEEANETAKEAFWHYMQKTLSSDYKYYLLKKNPTEQQTAIGIKAKIGKTFPGLKNFYKNNVRLAARKVQMHYEVMNPGSKYFNDFQGVVESFTKKGIH